MKKLFRFAFCAFALLAVLTLRAQPEAPNFPLPVRPDTLRILGVGNSFTDDGMMYLPELLEAAGIRNVVLGRLYYPGCSLRQHCEFDAADAPKYTYYKSERNRWTTVSEAATLREAVGDERWDVLVVQQSSAYSGIYTSYHPWLERLIERVRFYCPNAGACVAWQMTWAYGSGSDRRAARDGGVRDRNGDSHRYGDPEPAGGRVQQSAVGFHARRLPSRFRLRSLYGGLHVVPGARGALSAHRYRRQYVPSRSEGTYSRDGRERRGLPAGCAKSLRASFLGVGVSRVRRRRTIRETCRTHVSLFFVCRCNGSQKRIFAPTNQLRGSDGP